MAENVVFLEPGDERAQKIAKAMGSQTASDILQILGEGPRSLTDITDRLNIPMNTAKYHIGNLLDAGLIAVAQTKYSIKGREVKIYTLTNQLLVVAPRQANARTLLLKYASLFGIVALGSVIIAALSPLLGQGMPAAIIRAGPGAAMPQEGVPAAKTIAENAAANLTATHEAVITGTKSMADSFAANATPVLAATPAPTTMVSPAAPVGLAREGAGAIVTAIDPALAFFLGGVLVIVILLCYEAWLWKNHAR